MKKLLAAILLSAFSLFVTFSVKAEQSVTSKVKIEHSVIVMENASQSISTDRPETEEILTLWVEDEIFTGQTKEVNANANGPPHDVKGNSKARIPA